LEVNFQKKVYLRSSLLLSYKLGQIIN